MIIIEIKLTNWSANSKTVLRENFLLQKLNKSSKEGPSKSITIVLYSNSAPKWRTKGIPIPPARILYTLASYSN
jgi:hypothetical protein